MKLKLYGFRICPFVERTNILIAEKNIECEKVYVDIRNKPDWFIKLSPLGKVPILTVENTVIFESTVINEFLDEISPNSLHPECSIKKAQNRSWIEWGSSLLADAYYMTLAATDFEFNEKQKIVSNKLEILTQQLKNGPYFNGADFSMIDIAFAPLFRRFDSLKRLYHHDLLKNFPEIKRWSDNILQRPSVIQGFAENFDEEFTQLLTLKNSCLVAKTTEQRSTLTFKF